MAPKMVQSAARALSRSSSQRSQPNMKLDDIRAQLNKSRVDTIDMNVDTYPEDWFVPAAVIDSILSERRIEDLSLDGVFDEKKHTDFTRQERVQLARDVVSKRAKNKVALLIDLRLPHLVRDMVNISRALPVDEQALASFGITPSELNKIMKYQYHFIEVTLLFRSVLPQHYDDRVIMPLGAVEGGYSNNGAFGTIMEFALRDASFPKYNRLVRKQLESLAEDSSTAFTTELRNIGLLSSGAHPHVVPLLAAYTHRGKHNLIMPLIGHSDLKQIFETGTTLNTFDKDHLATEEFLNSLCGLVSALSSMHVLRTDTLDMIGCHRDLKPSNVLVDGTSLLITDFGLSRLVPAQELSGATPPFNNDDYVAPECRDMSKEGRRGERAGRKSDIWSLGCLLLNILILRYKGKKEGLANFGRSKKYGRSIYGYFWEQDLETQEKSLVSSVSIQLDDLREELTYPIECRQLASMVGTMLHIDPQLRPSASELSQMLQFMTIFQWSKKISVTFSELYEKTGSQSVYVENIRFKGWCEAKSLWSTEGIFSSPPSDTTETPWDSFNSIVECLRKTLQVLRSDGIVGQESKDPKRHLRACVSLLVSRLTLNEEAFAQASAQISLLGTEEIYLLEDLLKHAVSVEDKRMQQMAEAKIYQLQSMPQRGFRNLARRFELDLTQAYSREGKLHIVELPDSKQDISSMALAEDMSFPPTEAPQDHNSHIARVVELLRKSEGIEEIHTLKLQGPGYFYNKQKQSYGLLYQLPTDSEANQYRLLTLEWILKSQNSLSFSLALGERFALAAHLARSVHRLHALGWYHAHLSTTSVAFLYHSDLDRNNMKAKQFYLLGFAHIRTYDSETDSYGLSSDEQKDYYRHPKYQESQHESRAEFDYYALGILLLEIGLAKPLPQVKREHRLDSGLFEENDILENCEEDQPLFRFLKSAAGSRYESAVKACLKCSYKTYTAGASHHATESEILSYVLRPLEQCEAANV